MSTPELPNCFMSHVEPHFNRQEFKQFMYKILRTFSWQFFRKLLCFQTGICLILNKCVFLEEGLYTSIFQQKSSLKASIKWKILDIFALLYVWIHLLTSVVPDSILGIAILMLLNEVLFVWELPFKLSSGSGVYFPHCLLFQETSS